MGKKVSKGFEKDLINLMKNIELIGVDKAEFVVGGEVKKWGTGAHIPSLKKFIGRKVRILILKQERKNKKA